MDSNFTFGQNLSYFKQNFLYHEYSQQNKWSFDKNATCHLSITWEMLHNKSWKMKFFSSSSTCILIISKILHLSSSIPCRSHQFWQFPGWDKSSLLSGAVASDLQKFFVFSMKARVSYWQRLGAVKHLHEMGNWNYQKLETEWCKNREISFEKRNLNACCWLTIVDHYLSTTCKNLWINTYITCTVEPSALSNIICMNKVL